MKYNFEYIDSVFKYFLDQEYNNPLSKPEDPKRKISNMLRIRLAFSEVFFWIGLVFLCIVAFLLVKLPWNIFDLLNPVVIILLIVSLFCFAIALRNTFRRVVYVRHGIIAKSIIKFIEFVPSEGEGDGSYDYYLEFKTKKYDLIQTKVRLNSFTNYTYRNDKQLRIVYLSWDPAKVVYLNSFPQKYIDILRDKECIILI